MSPNSPDQHRVLDAIVERAAKDRAYRAQLLDDPRQAIHDAFGVQIPADFRIRFIERDPGVDALVVLPDLEPDGERELSDEELEAVAGGHGAHASWSRIVIKVPPMPPTIR